MKLITRRQLFSFVTGAAASISGVFGLAKAAKAEDTSLFIRTQHAGDTEVPASTTQAAALQARIDLLEGQLAAIGVLTWTDLAGSYNTSSPWWTEVSSWREGGYNLRKGDRYWTDTAQYVIDLRRSCEKDRNELQRLELEVVNLKSGDFKSIDTSESFRDTQIPCSPNSSFEVIEQDLSDPRTYRQNQELQALKSQLLGRNV